MTSLRRAMFLLLFGVVIKGSLGDTKYLMRSDASSLFRTKGNNMMSPGSSNTPYEAMESRSMRDSNDRAFRDFYSPEMERRNSYHHQESSTFNPDVLNKFLEEYANRIKGNPHRNYQYRQVQGTGPPSTTPEEPPLTLEIDEDTPMDHHMSTDRISEAPGPQMESSSTASPTEMGEDLNDTLKRNKHHFGERHDEQEDRNGWVTLDAIPWSKSKISKWQANTPTTSRPWPDGNGNQVKPWDKFSGQKPYPTDYTSRPTGIEAISKPWIERPNKPHWAEIVDAERIWSLSEKPKPDNSRPAYLDKFDLSGQAQKWPPERPWDKFGDFQRPFSDIITDEKPSNFPNSWDRLYNGGGGKPSFNNYLNNKYTPNKNTGDDDWRDYPMKFDHMADRYTAQPRPPMSSHVTQFMYQQNDHPSSHPSSGDGQWVLLSTHRGYSKSRQRALKLDSLSDVKFGNGSRPMALQQQQQQDQYQQQQQQQQQPPQQQQQASQLQPQDFRQPMKVPDDPSIPVMTSKRQVRLTVLPSANSTNTTTSHGGLLEVEKTFKTVDQSRREYELQNKYKEQLLLSNKRPIRNTNKKPSSSAVLAAVGAGMLPASLAMVMLPLMGRKKRSIEDTLHSQEWLRLVNGSHRRIERLHGM